MFKFFSKNKSLLEIKAPADGTIIPITSVPDQVFSTLMMGDGIAIEVTGNKITAPCHAKVTVVAQTKHAIGLELDNGVEILIHVGLDTVSLQGKGFTTHVSVGDKVNPGDLLLSIDRAIFTENNIPLITPIIVCNSSDFPIKNKTNIVTAKANETVLFSY